MTTAVGDPWPGNYWGGWYPNYQPQPIYYYQPVYPPVLAGCVCPAGAEKTCEGPMCPRRKPDLAAR